MRMLPPADIILIIFKKYTQVEITTLEYHMFMKVYELTNLMYLNIF